MKTKGISQYSIVFLRAFHFANSAKSGRWICYVMAFLCIGCNHPSTENKNENPFNPDKDYFPHKVKIKYAKGFLIKYFNNYKVLDLINPFKKKSDTLRYALVQRGTPYPAGFNNNRIIEIPVRNLICLSTTHIALTDFLDANQLVTGLSDTSAVCNTEIRQRIKNNKITEVGRSQTLNNELVTSMNPELIMAVGQPESRSENYQLLEASGIKVLINSEWMEVSSLGRMEWVKLLAALLNKEKMAEEKFNSIEHHYSELIQLTKFAKHKPTVIIGNTYKGTWSVAGGNSYAANLLKDAGANYHWANDTTTGNLAISLEAAYEVALNADYWFNPGGAKTLDDMVTQDIRCKDFKTFINGTIFNNTKSCCKGGGNDYWESGLVNPQLVLSDLIKILHPELLQGYETIYYEKLKNK